MNLEGFFEQLVQILVFLTTNQDSKLFSDLGSALIVLIFIWFGTLAVGVERPRFKNRSDEEPTLIRPRGRYFILVILFRSSSPCKRHMIGVHGKFSDGDSQDFGSKFSAT